MRGAMHSGSPKVRHECLPPQTEQQTQTGEIEDQVKGSDLAPCPARPDHHGQSHGNDVGQRGCADENQPHCPDQRVAHESLPGRRAAARKKSHATAALIGTTMTRKASPYPDFRPASYGKLLSCMSECRAKRLISHAATSQLPAYDVLRQRAQRVVVKAPA